MKYSELKKLNAPKILVEAIKLFGIKEVVGPQHNNKEEEETKN